MQRIWFWGGEHISIPRRPIMRRGNIWSRIRSSPSSKRFFTTCILINELGVILMTMVERSLTDA